MLNESKIQNRQHGNEKHGKTIIKLMASLYTHILNSRYDNEIYEYSISDHKDNTEVEWPFSLLDRGMKVDLRVNLDGINWFGEVGNYSTEDYTWEYRMEQIVSNIVQYGVIRPDQWKYIRLVNIPKEVSKGDTFTIYGIKKIEFKTGAEFEVNL